VLGFLWGLSSVLGSLTVATPRELAHLKALNMAEVALAETPPTADTPVTLSSQPLRLVVQGAKDRKALSDAQDVALLLNAAVAMVLSVALFSVSANRDKQKAA